MERQEISEKLAIFNNISLSKRQWDIILPACGCPKTSHFWTALRKLGFMRKEKHNCYTLIDMNLEALNNTWELYLTYNRYNVNKSHKKKVIRAAMKLKPVNITLYLINGALTDEREIID